MYLRNDINEKELLRKSAFDIETSHEELVALLLWQEFPDNKKEAEYYARNSDEPGDDVPDGFKQLLNEWREKEKTECMNCWAPLWDDQIIFEWHNKEVRLCNECYPMMLIKWLWISYFWNLLRIINHFYTERKRTNEDKDIS